MRLRWFVLAGAVCWTAVAATWMRPTLLANEMVYLLTPLRQWTPDLLALDWTFGGPLWPGQSALFGLLAAPLWGLFDEPELVAMVGRGIGWAVMLAALFRLSISLRVHPRWLTAGFIAWLLCGQGHAASEWIWLGFERKNFAHAAVLWAIAELIDGRLLRAGLLTGLAMAFHVLVGGWFAIGAGLAVLLGMQDHGLRGLVRFVGGAVLVGGPFVGMTAIDVYGGPAPAVVADPARQAWLMTAFRNPHHTLPEHFLDRWELLSLVGLAAVSCWAALKSLGVRRTLVLIAVLGCCVGLYVAGWAAGRLDAPRLLTLYPFRLGDVLVPLFAWLLVPQAVAGMLIQRGGPRRGLDMAAAALAVTIGAGLLWQRAPTGIQEMRATYASWPQRAHPLAETSAWIRANTDKTAVFAAPICEFDFWVRARRPMVASFKAAPHGARAIAWYERLHALSGRTEPLRATGFDVCGEVNAGFAKLDRSQLQALRTRFGATHYVVRGGRADLAELQVHRGARYAVYDLSALSAL